MNSLESERSGMQGFLFQEAFVSGQASAVPKDRKKPGLQPLRPQETSG